MVRFQNRGKFRAMLSGNDSDRNWEKLGASEPYFGVLTSPRFRKAALDEKALAEFFASGEAFVEDLLGVVRHKVDAEFAPRHSLEFGCGVGRLLIPLAARSESVTGIDISESMLAEARKNCDARGLTNVALNKSDDDLTLVDKDVDFIVSFIVFQHIPPSRGEGILRALMKRLVVGGVAVVHFTYGSPLGWSGRFERWFQRSFPLGQPIVNLINREPLGQPQMQMYDYDLNRIFRILGQSGCDAAHMYLTDHAGYQGMILFVQKRLFAKF